MSQPAEVDEAPGKTLAERALVLNLNGWWPACAVAYVLMADLLRSSGIAVVLVVATLVSPVIAMLFSLALGPFLCRWRASMAGNGYVWASALLSTGLMLWAVLTLSLFRMAVLHFAGWGTSPSEDFLVALDGNLDGLGYGAVVLAWMSGLVVCLWCRERLRGEALLYAGAVPWRKALGLVLLVPYGLAGLTAAFTVWQGARLNLGLRSVYAQEIASAVSHKGWSDEKQVEAELPPDFRQQPAVATWIAHDLAKAVDKNAVLKLWCQEAARLWTGPEFWKSPQLLALARLALSRGVLERQDVKPSLRAEVAVRAEVVLIERGGVGPTHSQRLYELKLPALAWSGLVDLALTRTDLLQAASLTDDDVRDRFVQAGARVLSKSDYDMDGNLQRKFFQRCAERAHLNGLWRAYEAGKPYPRKDSPLTLDEFRKHYAASLAFDLNAVDSDISQVTFGEDLARQGLAYDIVLMELKRLEAAKARLPRKWSEFRPEIGALGRAYSDWIELTPVNQGVNLRRTNPRRGVSLTHSFKAGD
jgi:hypothetical protein